MTNSFSINRAALKTALDTCKPIAKAANRFNDALKTVRFTALATGDNNDTFAMISAHNGDCAVSVPIDVENATSGFNFAVDHAALSGVLRKVKGTGKGKHASVSVSVFPPCLSTDGYCTDGGAYTGRVEIDGVPVSTFPHDGIPSAPRRTAELTDIGLSAGGFLAALNAVRDTASDDQSRPGLVSILMRIDPTADGLMMVATDGNRLSMATCRHDDPDAFEISRYAWTKKRQNADEQQLHNSVDCLLPLDGVDSLMKALTAVDANEPVFFSLDFRFQEQDLAMGVKTTGEKPDMLTVSAVGHFTVTMRLIGEQYPEFERIIPDRDGCHMQFVDMSPKAMAAAIDKVSAIVTRSERGYLSVSLNGKIELTQHPGKGGTPGLTARTTIPYAGTEGESVHFYQNGGKPFVIGFNPFLLGDSFRQCAGQVVKFRFQDDTSPVRIDDETEKLSAVHVVMSVRLD